jgi:hypothetical protein
MQINSFESTGETPTQIHTPLDIVDFNRFRRFDFTFVHFLIDSESKL